MIDSWKKASDDLKIKIQAPFMLITKDKGTFQFDLLIEGFGSPLGTVILSIDNMDEFYTPEEYGYYCSALNSDRYETYNRQRFIDTLTDWGYFGEISKTPDWYFEQE